MAVDHDGPTREDSDPNGTSSHGPSPNGPAPNRPAPNGFGRDGTTNRIAGHVASGNGPGRGRSGQPRSRPGEAANAPLAWTWPAAHVGPIEDYALIGDCRTAALVSRTGAIDWLCWPRFDSPACMAALLGTPENGFWRIAPIEEPLRITRQYRPDTMILETVFETRTGTVALIDFMAIDRQSVGRIVEGRAGSVPMAFQLVLRFEYGTAIPWVTRRKRGIGIRAVAGPDQVVLHSDVRLQGRALTTEARFTAEAGQRTRFALRHASSNIPRPMPPDVEQCLAETEAAWKGWSRHRTYHGPYEAAVQQSLLTLKALSYGPTGGIVAAPTASLPEELGGERNWDYRYCWLRDAAFTLQALMRAGYREEARAWGGWLRRSVAGTPSQLQILYGLAGERRVVEWEADWLRGYEGSRPVRIGNAASGQLQLDVFGEVIDALYHEAALGLVPPDASWALQTSLARHVEQVWEKPDESIWEVRGGPRQFTFSKVMVWVAIDRVIRGAERFGLPAPLERWRALRQRIHDTVCREGYNARRGAFVQCFGGDSLDASLLLIPLVGFLPADDPRVRGTVDAIGRELMVDGLVRRYLTHETKDGLNGGEGVFLACSFWYVDNLLLQGRLEEGRALFERLLALRNDVGLLAEEYDPASGRQLGNFPQAFSHLALVNTALYLEAQEAASGANRRDPGRT